MYAPKLPTPTKHWQEAKDFCTWVGDLSGYPIDLPTEAQWEFMARSGGKHVLFPTDTGNLDFGKNFPIEGEGQTFPVDRFPANPLGVFGLAGNATDWVNDWYGEDYYRHSPTKNPRGPETGLYKVKRGSNYPENPLSAASIVRRWPDNPQQDAYYPGTGFRCSVQTAGKL